MRKSQVALIIVFLVGILLGGVGCGIAVLEYASFSYEGEIRVGEEYMVTKELEFELPKGEERVVLARNQISRDNPWQLKEDETVPEGILRYQVTYNEKELEPFLDFESAEDIAARKAEEEQWMEENLGETAVTEEEPDETSGEEELCGVLNLYADYYYNDNLEDVMKYKDQFLEDLKQKKFSTYRLEYISQVTILANPKTMERIEAEWR